MSNAIGSAALVLTTNATKLYAGLSEAASKSKAMAGKIGQNVKTGVSSGLGKLGSAVGGLVKGGAMAAVGVAAVAAAGSVGVLYKAIESIQEISQQGDMAKALGVTPEFFTGLSGAASTFGVDANGVFEGLVNMGGKAAEALKGGDIGQSFRKLGIDVQSFAGMGIEQQFATLTQALSNVADPAERVRMGMAVMGEEAGKKLAPLLSKSQEELKKLTGQFAVSAAEMSKMKKADDAMKAVTASVGALWRKVVVAVAPIIEFFATKLTAAIEAVEPVINWVARAFTTHWTIIIDILGEVFSAIGEVITEVANWVSSLLGLENITTTIEEVVVGVWRAIGIAGAYAWDTIKAGMGIVAIGVGYLVKGVSGLIDVFAEVVGIAKELPDDLRPAGLDNFIRGVEEVRDNVKQTGDSIKNWGVDAVNNFGKSADKVRGWFDKKGNFKKPDAAAPGAAPAPKAPIVQEIKYEAVAAAVKGSKEALSIEARFRTEGMLDPKIQLQKQQLAEQQKAVAAINKVVEAVSNIRLPILNVF